MEIKLRSYRSRFRTTSTVFIITLFVEVSEDAVLPAHSRAVAIFKESYLSLNV